MQCKSNGSRSFCFIMKKVLSLGWMFRIFLGSCSVSFKCSSNIWWICFSCISWKIRASIFDMQVDKAKWKIINHANGQCVLLFSSNNGKQCRTINYVIKWSSRPFVSVGCVLSMFQNFSLFSPWIYNKNAVLKLKSVFLSVRTLKRKVEFLVMFTAGMQKIIEVFWRNWA